MYKNTLLTKPNSSIIQSNWTSWSINISSADLCLMSHRDYSTLLPKKLLYGRKILDTTFKYFYENVEKEKN